MNRGDIIRMAEEADAYADKKLGLGEWHPDKHEVRDDHFATLVAAHEREACAKVADEWQTEVDDPRYQCDCAAAIRARGEI
jgi:hypothetical protein